MIIDVVKWAYIFSACAHTGHTEAQTINFFLVWVANSGLVNGVVAVFVYVEPKKCSPQPILRIFVAQLDS